MNTKDKTIRYTQVSQTLTTMDSSQIWEEGRLTKNSIWIKTKITKVLTTCGTNPITNLNPINNIQGSIPKTQ